MNSEREAPSAGGRAEGALLGDVYKTSEVGLFKEASTVLDLINRIAQGDHSDKHFVEIGRILSTYQEQPELIDPVLPEILKPLMALLETGVNGDDNIRCFVPRAGSAAFENALFRRVGTLIHLLSTVRGPKTIVRFFPNDVFALNNVLECLEGSHTRATILTLAKEAKVYDCSLSAGGLWEIRHTLLLWLSILVLSPFRLESFDQGPAETTQLSVEDDQVFTDVAANKLAHAFLLKLEAHCPKTVLRIVQMCIRYLQDPGSLREMGALVLVKLLCRPDCQSALSVYFDWATEIVQCSDMSPQVAQFLIPGLARSLAGIFKHGTRRELECRARALFPLVSHALLPNSAPVSGQKTGVVRQSSIVRQLGIKLIQRMGMILLPPRVISWRYSRGQRFLADNLKGVQTGTRDANGIIQLSKPVSEESTEWSEDGEEEADDIPEQVEEAFDFLLNGLRDNSTVVRWSAAKGIGRLTLRLPMSFADEIASSVIGLLSPLEDESAWHGACLALAELARRGLLLPNRLHGAIPRVCEALIYDIRRGSHSVGSQVRDAAAYVCWAFARAYTKSTMGSYAQELANFLLVIACFDREVNCRRAAAAAFQELVGRVGNIQDGLRIVTVADYFALGPRHNAFTSVSVKIAKTSHYRRPLLDHVMQVKLKHWDASVRELAACAVAKLSGDDPQWVTEEAIPQLMSWTLARDRCQRHGALMTLASILNSMGESGHLGASTLQQSCKDQLVKIPAEIEEAGYCKGKGGELMREAILHLMSSFSTARIDLGQEQLNELVKIANENLFFSSDPIQELSASTIGSLCQTYGLDERRENFLEISLKYYWSFMEDESDNAYIRRGIARVFGQLPWQIFDAECVSKVLKSTRDLANRDIGLNDPDTRIVAVESIGCLCTEIEHSDLRFPVESLKGPPILGFLVISMDDYTTDNRGDIGSLVREAAMTAMAKVCSILAEREELDEDTWLGVIALLAKQAGEKIDRTRKIACRELSRVVHLPTNICRPNQRLEFLTSTIPPLGSGSSNFALTGIEETHWSEHEILFPTLSKLFRVGSPIDRCIFQGLCIAIGGLSESLSVHACQSLAASANWEPIADPKACFEKSWFKIVGGHIRHIFRHNYQVDKIICPLMRTIDYLAMSSLFEPHATLEELDMFASEVIDFVRAELQRCRDLQKLMLAVSLLCTFASKGWAVTSALQALVVQLASRFPKVRVHTAENMYTALLTVLEEGMDTEGACHVLEEIRWDDNLVEVVKPARNRIVEHLGLRMPVVVTVGTSSRPKPVSAAEQAHLATGLQPLAA